MGASVAGDTRWGLSSDTRWGLSSSDPGGKSRSRSPRGQGTLSRHRTLSQIENFKHIKSTLHSGEQMEDRGGLLWGTNEREDEWALQTLMCSSPPPHPRTRPSRTLTPAPSLSSLPASGHRHSPVHQSSGLTGTWQHGHHLKSRLCPCFLSVVATAIWNWSFIVQEFPDNLSPDALSHDTRKEGPGAQCWPSLRTTEPHAREGTTACLHCTLASVPEPLVNWQRSKRASFPGQSPTVSETI